MKKLTLMFVAAACCAQLASAQMPPHPVFASHLTRRRVRWKRLRCLEANILYGELLPLVPSFHTETTIGHALAARQALGARVRATQPVTRS